MLTIKLFSHSFVISRSFSWEWCLLLFAVLPLEPDSRARQASKKFIILMTVVRQRGIRYSVLGFSRVIKLLL